MNELELRKELHVVSKQLIEANNEFNNAIGLFVDVFTYKIKYLEALRTALMKDLKEETNIYKKHRHSNRNEYLQDLAYTYDVDFCYVEALAGALGESEDFDGLVSAVQDMEGR